MYDLTIVKKNGGAYIDSRQVAACIDKPHRHLLRDIRGYISIIQKNGAPNFGLSDFFIESTYTSAQNKEFPCYLLSKMACELVAHKLTGERGVLFTVAYVKRFNELEAAERAELEAKAVTPQLRVFNTAVRQILDGYSDACATTDEVLSFLRNAYKPFGIEVAPDSGKRWWTVTEIAAYLRMYSESGLFHGHAVSAIIDKLNLTPEHISIVPYGMVGISMRYDSFTICAIEDWLVDNDFPHDIPYLGFEYHVYYDFERCEQLSLFMPDLV